MRIVPSVYIGHHTTRTNLTSDNTTHPELTATADNHRRSQQAIGPKAYQISQLQGSARNPGTKELQASCLAFGRRHGAEHVHILLGIISP